jgi:hypothetical protein
VDGWESTQYLDVATRQRSAVTYSFQNTTGDSCLCISQASSDDVGSPPDLAVSVLFFEARAPEQEDAPSETVLRICHVYPPRPEGAESQQVVHLQWPWGLQYLASNTTFIPDCCDGEGSLVFHQHDSRTQRFFRVSPADGRVQLLAGPAPGVDDKQWDSHRDHWHGCSRGPVKLPDLSRLVMDSNGHLVGFDKKTGALVRICLGLKPPVHLQPPPAPPPPPPAWEVGTPIDSQLNRDWGVLLASGEGADVELRCAGGRVLKAHSQVLLARCEWFRRRHSSGLHQGAAAELPEHTGATMACVLQYLYTGHACMSTKSNEAASEGAAASTPSPTAPADDGAAGKPTTGLWQLLRSVPYFQGLSDHDPVALVPLVVVAADQLQLPDLHEACLQLAQRQLSPKTALPWLLAAHMGRQEALEKSALQYVIDNMAGAWARAPMPMLCCC